MMRLWVCSAEQNVFMEPSHLKGGCYHAYAPPSIRVAGIDVKLLLTSKRCCSTVHQSLKPCLAAQTEGQCPASNECLCVCPFNFVLFAISLPSAHRFSLRRASKICVSLPSRPLALGADSCTYSSGWPGLYTGSPYISFLPARCILSTVSSSLSWNCSGSSW